MSLVLIKFFYTVLVVPGKPLNVEVKTTCKAIQLTWQKPASDGGMEIKNYIIRAHKNIGYNTNAYARMYKIPVVFEPETTYKVSISARNHVGEGPENSKTVTTKKYCKYSNMSVRKLKEARKSFPCTTVKFFTVIFVSVLYMQVQKPFVASLSECMV